LVSKRSLFVDRAGNPPQTKNWPYFIVDPVWASEGKILSHYY